MQNFKPNMKLIIFLVLVLSITFCFADSLTIPHESIIPKKYLCFRTADDIIIDGKLDEISWSKAKWTEDFVDIEGNQETVPRFRTRAKMVWDKEYFYIAAQLEEPDIWATLQNRDDIIFYDNDFEVFIDPDGNTREYSEFEMNALNTIWDLLLIMPYRDIDQAAVHGWDIKNIMSGVYIQGTLNTPGDTDEYWTVEIAFPFEAFKEIANVSIPPQDGDHWRVNFSRVEWKTEVKDGEYQKLINPDTGKPFPEDNWVWSPQGVINMHYPEMWGYVQFSNKTVGSGEVTFQNSEEETAKRFLRKIYYHQKNYYEKTSKYSNSLESLNLEFKMLPGFSSVPVIECTSNMYEAWLVSDDGLWRFNINQHGLTWKTQLKGNNQSK